MKPIAEQIEDALNTYVAGSHSPGALNYDPSASVMTDLHIKTAMLSGMSLAAHFLAINDGHPQITPQAIRKACMEVGKRMNLLCAPLSPRSHEES